MRPAPMGATREQQDRDRAVMGAAVSAAIVLAAAVLSACTPESRNTLPPEDRVAADMRFVGTWVTNMMGTEYRARVRALDERTLAVRFTETSHFAGRVSAPLETEHVLSFYRVGGQEIVAARGPGLQEDTGPVYRFATYRFGGPDSVALYFLSEQDIYPRVHAARLLGRIRGRDPLFRDILLLEGPERLAGLMRSETPARLFSVTFGPFARR